MNEAGKQKYDIAQCQSQEITLSKYVGSIPSIFMTIDMSSSSRIKKLPSSYSFESAEWKVLPEKKKKELRNVHFLHLVDFTEFRPFYMANTLFQTGEFFKIVLREKTSSPVLQPRFSQVTIKSVFIFRYTEFTIASNLSLPLFHTAQKPSAFEIAFVCLFRNKLFISVKIGFALWSKLVS